MILAKIQRGGSVAGWMQYASFLQRSERVEEAETVLQRVLRGSNFNGAIAVQLGKLYKSNKMYDKADKLYKDLTHNWQPSFLTGIKEYANFLVDTIDDPIRANSTFSLAVVRNPDCASVRNDYALFLKKLKHYDAAEEQYVRGLELKPSCPHLNNNYALFLKNIRGNMAMAELRFLKGIQLQPSALLHANYAVFLETVKQDYPAARAQYQASVEMDVGHPEPRANLAIFLYETQHDYVAAEIEFKAALKQSPNSAFLLVSYASFLFKVKLQGELAEEYYRKALKVDPSYALAHHSYAQFLQANRRAHDPSFEVLVDKAVSLDSNHFEFWHPVLIERQAWRESKGNSAKCFEEPICKDIGHIIACVLCNALY